MSSPASPGAPRVVQDWRRAQALVTFPLWRPQGRALEISVRPWSPDRWPTVRSLHRFREATVRLKQLVLPPVPSTFPPLLSYLAGGQGLHNDHLYGSRVRTFRVRGAVVVHGTHFQGQEGGETILDMVLQDLVVREGHLGTAGLRDFVRGMRRADPRAALERLRQPLHAWNWSLHERRDMWSCPPGRPWPTVVRWTSGGRAIHVGRKRLVRPPSVPGFDLDTIGRETGHRGVLNSLHLYYRPRRGHMPLAARLCLQGRLPADRSGPLYATSRTRIDGRSVRVVSCPAVGGARIDITSGGTRLVVMVPPPVTVPLGKASVDPLELVRPLVRQVGPALADR